MIGKKILVSTLAAALVAGMGVSAYAANPEVSDTVCNIFSQIQTDADSDVLLIPEDAVALDKIVEVEINGEKGFIISVSDNDELPAMPEGAQPMDKAVVEK